MKKGKIVEKGNHTSLLKEFPDGIYAKLVKQQEAIDENAGDGEQNKTGSQDVPSIDENKISYSNQKYSTGAHRKENIDGTQQVDVYPQDNMPARQPSLKQ